MKKHQELTLIKRFYGLFGEVRSDELPVSSLEEALEAAKKSEGCFGFMVNQREYVNVEGKRFYNPEVECVQNVVLGKVLTREQVEKMTYIGKYLILQQMNEDKADTVVELRTGRFVSTDDFKGATFVGS